MENVSHELVKDVKLPKMVKIHQKFDDSRIEDLEQELLKKLEVDKIRATLRPGMRVAITGSSRGITSHDIPGEYIPIVAETEEDAIKAAVFTCVDINYSKVEIIRIVNTLKVNDIWVSETLMDQAKARNDMEVLSEPEEFSFDENGEIVDRG